MEGLLPITEIPEARPKLDSVALLAEVRRLHEDGRERDAASLVQRNGEASTAAFLDKVFRADPADAWALDHLNRVLWSQNQLAEIKAVLELPARDDAVWMGQCWKMLLAAKSQKFDGLANVMRFTAKLGSFPIYVERELAALRCLKELDSALAAAVADGTVGMSFAALHVRRACHKRQWDVRRHFKTWIERCGVAAVEPVGTFLDAIGDAREAEGIVSEMIREIGPWMHEQTVLFGKTGFALENSGLHEEAVVWLQGCEQRTDLQGWFVANYVTALWWLHRYEDAAQVSSIVLERGLRDNTWNWHVAAAAYGHALAGRTEQAVKAIEALTPDGTHHAEFGWALELARSMVRAQRLPRAETKRVFDEERARLRHVIGNFKQESVPACERYRLALKAISAHGGFHLWPWQKGLGMQGETNPILTKTWLAGVACLALALLRGCMVPSGEGLFESDQKSQQKGSEFEARSPTDVEIEKVLSRPTGTR